MNDSVPPLPPAPKTVGVVLLTSDMMHVQDVRIPTPSRAMPDAILWHGRVFGRERIRDPHGARRWHYVEITCVAALE